MGCKTSRVSKSKFSLYINILATVPKLELMFGTPNLNRKRNIKRRCKFSY